MKKLMVVLMVAALATAAQAVLIDSESFDAADQTLLSAHNGWTVSGGQDPLIVDGSGGYWGGGSAGPLWPVAQHTNWWLTQASRTLSSTVDLTVDGTAYMSFILQSDQVDMGTQVGLANATNELMAGNAYDGGGKGITAYYGALNGGFQTNCDGTSIDSGWWGELRQYQVVIALDKTNSGVTDDLSVTIDYYLDWYDGTAEATRTVSLTGVSDVFDSLALKSDGWNNMDEILLGTTLADVTVVPEPATMALLGLGSLVCLRRKK